jgi:serine/threonine-protein phosphatase PP1 catalytic subunit
MEETPDVDGIIDALVTRHSRPDRCLGPMVKYLCFAAKNLMLEEETVLDLEPPIRVCGDIHGQLHDLLRFLDMDNFNSASKYLFLGDYVDRGDNSLEVICLLLALKIRYPDKIFLLRGNHENPAMNRAFGFDNECVVKGVLFACYYFTCVFDSMPLAAVIGKKLFCVHGGIGPSLQTIDDIRKIKRPRPIPESGLMNEILWSDPSAAVTTYGPNPRGDSTWRWGLEPAKEFMEKNGLIGIIRAHQSCRGGISFPFAPDTSVVTIFGASGYRGRDNSAAMICLGETLSPDVRIFHPISPPVKRRSMRRAVNKIMRSGSDTKADYLTRVDNSRPEDPREVVG